MAGLMPVAMLPELPGWPLLVTLALLGAGASALGRGLLRAAGGSAIGFTLAVTFGHELLARRLPDDCSGAAVRVVGTVASLPARRELNAESQRQRFEFRVDELQPAYCTGPKTILLSYFGDERLQPGQRWRFAATLQKPWGLANPGSANMQAWFAQTGIDAVGSIRRGYLLAPPSGGRVPHHRLRYRLAANIDRLGLEGDTAAVLRALTVADRSGIDGSLWRLFQAYGVNHLLVISGLHIGMVAGLGYLLGGVLARLCGLVSSVVRWRAGAACMLATVYAALAGFTLPTQRALCMLAAVMLALALGRSARAGRVLLLAAVLVLTINPLAGLGAGFWLSFGAVLMLLWLSAWQVAGSRLVRALCMHTAMALFMLPLGAWFFGGGSLVAALANFLLIPLVGLLVVPVTLLAAAFSLAGATVPASLLWQLLAVPIELLLAAAGVVHDSHGDWMYRDLRAGLPQLLLGLAAVAGIVVPLSWRVRTVALLLLVPLLLPLPMKEPASGEVRPVELTVTVLDVGQGTAVVLRSGDKVLVYDTGGGDPAGSNLATSVVVPYLRAAGVTALDTLVISHGDLDHSAGSSALGVAFAVSRVRYGDRISGLTGGRYCRAGEAWRWSRDIRFQFLSPAVASEAARNDRSCVLQVSVGTTQLLLPGDVGSAVERDLVSYWGQALGSDWLLAPHHGSNSSSSWPFLKWVGPAHVAVSSGYNNRFGHPHAGIVARYQALSVGLSNTARAGAISFTVDAHGIGPIQSYREKYHRYWM